MRRDFRLIRWLPKKVSDRVVAMLAMGCVCLSAAAADNLANVPAGAAKFLQANCCDCHQGDHAEAGLDLTEFVEPANTSVTSSNRDPLATWVRCIDRVAAGEMPPPDAAELSAREVNQFVTTASTWIGSHETALAAELGRVQGRRLTNLQLERTLQDLLGIDIPLARDFSDEPRSVGFNTVADGQAMSHFQLEQHLAAVDRALGEAFRRVSQQDDESIVELSPRRIARQRQNSRTREPEIRDGLAVVWSGRLIFYGRIPATTADEPGWFRFNVTASALKPPADHGVWCTVTRGRCISSSPLLVPVSEFEATEIPQTWTFETWLDAEEMIEIRPNDLTLGQAKFAGGQVGTGEGEDQDVPGVAMHEITLQRVHHGPTRDVIQQILFGDLKVNRNGLAKLDVIAADAKPAATKLMTAFATRAFRRPVTETEIEPYLRSVFSSLDHDMPLALALRDGYRSLLLSPRFLYFQESAGQLDDYSIASRLSYLLCNSMPDDSLLQVAAARQLTDRKVIAAETSRLLASPRGQDFVKLFADQWLDLRDIDFTEPDPRQFRDFDRIVQESMLDETVAFLDNMLVENRSVTELIGSDYTFLNSRLARYYGIGGVEGDAMRLVKLDPSSRRGGVITQGAILKITANGTTTSPVLRGVWVGERLLGEHVPPPPQNVPAIEPDIRGAVSIREMLAKHRDHDECAVCHVKIDPPGFALENYDPAGKWRDRYGEGGKRAKPIEIDASYQLSDGREFDDVDEFRRLIVANPQPIAACVAEKLVTYATGAPPRFSDRDEIQRIVEKSADSDFGFRTILQQVVQSPVFLTK